MAESQNNSQLNFLLINLGRSLLQYVEECWPWSGNETHGNPLDALVIAQKETIARLTDLLIQRRWNIDFGSYPTEYSDLHFVALDYLLLQLIENQECTNETQNSLTVMCNIVWFAYSTIYIYIYFMVVDHTLIRSPRNVYSLSYIHHCSHMVSS